VSNRRISLSQHINKSVKSSSHARRVTLADLTPGISTPQEHALWQHLYCMHTIGTRTQWNAFTAEWNGIADIHAQGGSKAIMHKRVDQLQKYQHKCATSSHRHMLLLARSRRLDSRHRHSSRSSRPWPVAG
jgi:hypothetical protein